MRYSGVSIGHTTKRFMQDRGGNFALMFGVVVATLAAAVGFGVDTVQLYNARTALRGAVDAAVTSTARDLTTGVIRPADAEKVVKAFLSANSSGGILTPGRITLDRLTVDQTARTVEAAAHVDVDLFFPLFGMDKTKRVTNTSAAIYSDKQIEVAMMLDLTGSMQKTRKTDKIGDLKAAAENAVRTMLDGQDPKNPRVRVAIVPYASGVNVGALGKMTYAETSSSSDLPPVAGSSLLVAKTGKTTLPSFGQYTSVVSSAFPNSDACATERKTRDGKADFTADGPDTVRTDKSGKQYYALVNRDNRLSGQGMNKCPNAKVIPLTADSAALLDSIYDFSANGYTGGAIGVQWTYYMLSPRWRSAIRSADLGDGPSDTNSKKISKVAILMTDGEFNTVYAGVSGTNNNGQGGLARGNAERICDNMKSDGIEVFTIGFALPSDEASAARDVLKNCSSTDKSSSMKHFFDVSTGEELNQAFQSIIANTERLALTQ